LDDRVRHDRGRHRRFCCRHPQGTLVTAAQEPGSPRSWDFLLTTFFILLLLAITAIFVVLSIGFGVATLGCLDSGAACNNDVITCGSRLVMFGAPVVALVATVFAIVFVSRRRIAFWVPIAGILAITGVYLLGSFLVSQAVQ